MMQSEQWMRELGRSRSSHTLASHAAPDSPQLTCQQLFYLIGGKRDTSGCIPSLQLIHTVLHTEVLQDNTANLQERAYRL